MHSITDLHAVRLEKGSLSRTFWEKVNWDKHDILIVFWKNNNTISDKIKEVYIVQNL